MKKILFPIFLIAAPSLVMANDLSADLAKAFDVSDDAPATSLVLNIRRIALELSKTDVSNA
ncbi:MAG: hypothetical protein FWG18_03260, partial [Alphaproteobacteria bacterium]|nr:hypothetical protein [Alphaproteobacteria bacterium]